MGTHARLSHLVRAVLLASCGAIALSAAARPAEAQEVLWVSDLESDAKLLGQEIVVEGSFQQRIGASRDQILLKGCKVTFQMAPELLRTVPSSLAGALRIKGTLVQQDGKLVVKAKSVDKVAATDVDRYRSAAARLLESDARGWFRLADRTDRLAAALESRELRGLAAEARRKGFRGEELSLKPPQFRELLELADRADHAGYGADESRVLRHKALRWQADAMASQSPTPADWLRLADGIAKWLPGATTMLKTNDAALAARYRTKPLELYESEPSGRAGFDRQFFIDITARSLLTAAQQPNADLVHLSEEAKRRTPDRPELALQLLEQWADAEASAMAKLASPPPASRIQRLVDVLRKDLNKPERAEIVLRQWLDARRSRLGRSADGRVQLAREYRTKLNDEATAAKLLEEALQIEPELPQASEELKSLGYVKGPNGWFRGSDRPSREAASPPTATRGRLPEPGMSPDQVRAILGTPRPEDILRLASAGQVIEQWLYKGPPDIHVSFSVTPKETKVLRINTVPRK